MIEVTEQPRVLKDGKPALARGEKRLLGGRIISAKEKKDGYVPRAQYVPVAEVISVDDVRVTAEEGRKQLLADLWVCWKQTPKAMNWMISQLFANDGPLEPGPKGLRLPKFKPPRPDDKSLYLGARKVAPDISSGSVSALAQAVTADYRGDQWEVRVLTSKSLRSYRSPQPMPIREQDYTISRDDHGRTLLSLPVRGRRWIVRLRAGPEFRRQMTNIENVIAGNGWFGAIDVIWGNKGDIMLAISTFLPKRASVPGGGTMIVRTRADKLWGVWIEDRENAWKLHEDHILRLLTAQRIAGHAEELQRLSDDSKAERRSPKSERSRINQRRRGVVDRYHDRVDDALHRAAALLANYANRRHVAKVVYDDTDRSYWPEGGPWYRLHEMVKSKLAAFGIEFEVVEKVASGEVVPKTP